MSDKLLTFNCTLNSELTEVVIDRGGIQFCANADELGSLITHLSYLHSRMLTSTEVCLEPDHSGESIPEQKHQEKLLIAEDFQYRNVLVREVHHRIKNNLQGVIGILRNFLAKYPELNDPITNVISQVHSIAVIHGLQGRAALTKVRLCELTGAIATSIESMWQTRVMVDIPPNWIPFLVVETEAVPLALVLNELISNAVKYGDPVVGVNITLRREPQSNMVQVTITNNGQLPSGFEFPPKLANGVGLQLIASLLPRKGASLSWEQQGKTVVVRFQLTPPIVSLEQ